MNTTTSKNLVELTADIRERMIWVFEDIRNTPVCLGCDKRIIKYVYHIRRCDDTFCSIACANTVLYEDEDM